MLGLAGKFYVIATILGISLQAFSILSLRAQRSNLKDHLACRLYNDRPFQRLHLRRGT